MTATKDLVHLCRALKAPTLASAVERLAERARTDGWTHEEFLAACLEREVAARQANGGELRIRAAKFPARKTLEDFDWDHQRSLKRDVIAHLGALDFIEAATTTSCSSARLAPARPTSRPASASGRVKPATGSCSPPPPNGSPDSPPPTIKAPFTTSSDASAATRCWLSTKSATSPSKPTPRTCSSSSISARYERASVIVTSNKPFGRWGEVFGDPVVAAAMIDRLVHHAEVVSLKGDSYRLKDRDLGRSLPTTNDTE